MSDHAIYAPSSAKRWINCTASAEAIAKLPEQEEGEAAAEGTAAHEEIERCLGDTHPAVNPDHPAAYGVSLLLDYVRQLPPGRLWIEQRVELTKDIWGRCDVAHFSDETLTIVDYKNGFVGVDAEENEQLMIYAAASIYTHNLPAKHIRLVVVQPNDFRPVPPVKQWVTTNQHLYEFAQRIAAIPKGAKSFRAGEHCRYCPLFGRCEPTRDLLASLSIALQHTPDEVRADQIATFMMLRKPIEDYFKGLDKDATKRAMAGTELPGMKLVATQKHRAWKDEAKAKWQVSHMRGASKVPEQYHDDLVNGRFENVPAEIVGSYYLNAMDALDVPTPAQAEKLGLDVEALTERPDGGPALAFASDKRKAWERKSAAEMFAGIGEVAK